jgi:hypothetical protein
MKDRQDNGQKKKDKRTSNDIQNTTQNAKDRETGGELRCPIVSFLTGPHW